MYKAHFEYIEREPEKILFSFIPPEKVKIKFRKPERDLVALVIDDNFNLDTGEPSTFIPYIVKKVIGGEQKEYYKVKCADGYEKFGVAPEID